MTQLWRHKKTGNLYKELYRGAMEADQSTAVIYQLFPYDPAHDVVWVRPEAEFMDGRFEPADADPGRTAEYNPWVPMNRPLDLKLIGKLGEELTEAATAIFRCIIQGLDEREPVTGKLNREWLEDELADVMVNQRLVIYHFGLDIERIRDRADEKEPRLRSWHAMLAPGDAAS